MIPDDKISDTMLEEIQACRAENIGLDVFVECLDVGPKACPYALPFGYAFLCNHPRLHEIVEQTRKAQLSGQSEG